MKLKKINPSPYLEISMECSNRRFYDVKQRVYDVALSFIGNESDGQVLYNDTVSEKCDYEGDLELLIVHNTPKTKGFIKAIFIDFGIKKNTPKEGVNIHITT
jgi:hypothetical protein